MCFATPYLSTPSTPYMESIRASVPLIKAAGWDCGFVHEVGCPYISCARSTMLRKAMDAKADIVVFIDYDLSWDAKDLLSLIETPGDVIAGTYRFKEEPEHYMGVLTGSSHPEVRADGCVKATRIPAGFLKITKEAVDAFMTAYPSLCYGPKHSPSIDLFNHGAHEGAWWGEDYAFSRNWINCGGEIWIVPDLNIDHWSGDKCFKGNFHKFLLKQPGGSESAHPDSRNAERTNGNLPAT